MARVVVEGMPETAVGGEEGGGGGAGEDGGGGGGGGGDGGGGVMPNRRRSKARRRKRKELFGVQMCLAAAALGLVAGLQSMARRAGEGQQSRVRPGDGAHA